jgi:ABC-2 type transport system permease protein
VGFVLGARIHAGFLGWIVVLAAAALVAASFSGISQGLALLTRREESMIAVANATALPLMFLSSILIAPELMPDWMREVARVNPVNWGVVVAREVVNPGTSWATVGIHGALLLAFTALTASFGTFAFRAYRRTL